MFPIGVSIVTGFLGSGKTTLINRLLSDPNLCDTAVIVNEFGEVAVDHLLVETANEEVIEIAGGCLCCTVRGELAETLADLVDRVQTGKIGRLSRVVIETTGLADPAPVLHAIQGDPVLGQAFRIDRVITTADALAGAGTLEDHEEARRQIALADIVLMTKTDLANPDQIDSFRRKLTAMTAAMIIDAGEVEASAAELLQSELALPIKRQEQHTGGHVHHHAHPSGISTHIVAHPAPVSWSAIEGFLDLLRSRPGLELLRVKGLVQTQEDPERPVVIQGVQGLLYPPRQLGRWPERAPRETVLVIIGSKLNSDEIDRLFRAFINLPQADVPDRMALENNPLAIPGTG